MAPLDPETCTGAWYSVGRELGRELLQLDTKVTALFRKAGRDEADDYERTSAVYLRQAIDHWLAILYKADITEKQISRPAYSPNLC